MKKQKITPRSVDYSQWYLDIVEQAEMAENSPVRGCMVIKPWGYAIWERMQRILDDKFKSLGVENAYFPLFIPKSFLTKEAKHIAGFAQESAVVTHHRLHTDPESKEITVDPEAKLTEELIVRPTSETIIYDVYSRWIESYRDLPLLINQWANVVRWELRTRPFLRTAEFLWQEGHTAHATEQEADDFARTMLEVYQWFAEEVLGFAVIAGEKSESERFAGANRTYSIEALMQDGKALQAGTSHNLGQNFAKAFNVQFAAADGTISHVWQTSWGVSTRLIGGLIMSHSDDQGLVLPPLLAPVQIIVVPIWKTEDERRAVENAVSSIEASLKSAIAELRMKVDWSEHRSIGVKFNYWETKGVPLRIEVGARELAEGAVTLADRISGEKTRISLDALAERARARLTEQQSELLSRSKTFISEHTSVAHHYDEFKELLESKTGFVWAEWDGSAETEAKIKAETAATIRNLPFDRDHTPGKDLVSGKPSIGKALFAKAY